jgi:hypothetical protein
MLTPVGKKLMDQRDGICFAPHVLLHELLRLVGLRTVKDLVHVQCVAFKAHVPADAAENLIDLVDSVRFSLGTPARQRLRRVRLVFRKIVLKNFR